MYINEIDELIDALIDNLYFNIVSKSNKTLSKILEESNFIKYQKDINQIMIQYIDTLDQNTVKNIVKSNDGVYQVMETFKRYVALYLFLTIGYEYTGKEDTYINNVVEFTKNQPEYNYKINNFFNSDSNALLISYNKLIRNIRNILTMDKSKLEKFKQRPDMLEAIEFINKLGGEFITQHILNQKDKSLARHNIIKSVIIILIYKTNEKKDFVKLLESTENLSGEYMYIDVVRPLRNYFDYDTLERVLGSQNKSNVYTKYLTYYFWELITEYEKELMKPTTSIEDKIIRLIESGIVYPICDDFLLYHKDMEKYETKLDHNKKGDTKIKYIVNKIDLVSEYYSERVKQNEKLHNSSKRKFYIPLLSRKATLVNHNEDINIINKYLNQSKISIENEEYMNDLLTYKIYPYINFKNFENGGFSIVIDKTIDAFRYVSFNKTGEFKQYGKNSIQHRITNKDLILNVVGFLIPANTKDPKCLKVKELIDIRSLSENEYKANGYVLMMNYLKEIKMGLIKHDSSVYWIWNTNYDKVESDIYEQYEKLSVSEQIKQMVALLYDDLVHETYNIILDKLKKFKELTLDKGYKLLDIYQNKLLNIKDNKELFNSIESHIYNTIVKADISYDESEDIIHGITDNLTPMIQYKDKTKKKKINYINVNLSGIKELIEQEEKEKVDGVCQHNVSWDQLISIQKTDPQKYADELYLFIQQYVKENVEGDYVCKSCGFQLNIKKFILDGSFDDNTQKFITYSSPMDIALEDIAEYAQYKVSIRNIEKMIEKIALISNIPNLNKISVNAKIMKRTLIKNTIDIILMNNRHLKTNLKERNENASKKYGINRDLSNLFVFELENSIFVFSPKDKDFYKPIKQNNIIIYLTLMIILEMSDTHITFIGGDKKGLCNFLVFDKIYQNLFSGLKIIINDRGETRNITDYKILCYVIYIIGCSVTRRNMWFYEHSDKSKSKKHIPIMQKVFIHTFVDIINSILEIANNSKPHYLYEIISVRLYKKLQSIFNSNELYNRLIENNKTNVIGDKKDFVISDKQILPLTGHYTMMTDFNIPSRDIYTVPTYYPDKKPNLFISLYPNELFNCSTGHFHDWKAKNGHFVCLLCDTSVDTLDIDLTKKRDKKTNNIIIKPDKKIEEGLKYIKLQNNAQVICYKDGFNHKFEFNIEKNEIVCSKCNNTDNHKYNNTQLDELYDKINKNKKTEINLMIKRNESLNEKVNKELSYNEKTVNYISKLYANDDKLLFIDEFINRIDKYIGDNISPNTKLIDNLYIVDHDHMGLTLDKPIIISDSSGKIFYKHNHHFFKTDVIYYTGYKSGIGKIETFYDATTKILLGFREESKNYTLNNKQDKTLVINYSIKNKIKLLGYPSQYINITKQYEDIKNNMFDTHDNSNIKHIILNNIISDRIENLKKTIYVFNRCITRIMNSYIEPIDEEMYFTNKINKLVNDYVRKLSGINLTDSNGKHLAFKHWKGITRGIFIDTSILDKFLENDDFIINIDDINKNDSSGNIILYFIVHELNKLLEYNTDKLLRINICNFIIDYINIIFDLFNIEDINYNINMKRFIYLLSSDVREIAEDTGSKLIEGIYGDIEEDTSDPDVKDAQEDLIEEQEALDMDIEYQYESAYEHTMEFVDSLESRIEY